MSLDWVPIQEAAASALALLGTSITLTYESGEVINDNTGVVTTPATVVQVTGNGVTSRYKNAEIDGEVIRRSDIKLILENVSTEPQPGWNATIKGKLWRVMDCSPISPAATNLIYVIQLRI